MMPEKPRVASSAAKPYLDLQPGIQHLVGNMIRRGIAYHVIIISGSWSFGFCCPSVVSSSRNSEVVTL